MIICIKKFGAAETEIPESADKGYRRRKEHAADQINENTGQQNEQDLAKEDALNGYSAKKIAQAVIIRHQRAEKP